jgi:tetratricopeptide (TPR) repeat protein
LKGRSIGVAGIEQIALVADFHLALLHTKSGQFELAMKWLRKLGSRQIDNPELERAMGMAALRLALLPKELPDEKQGIAADVGRAVLLDAQGRRDEARLEWTRLIEKHSSVPNAHYAFGEFLVSKEPDAALEEFRRELEVSPDHVPARVQIALEYLQRGKASEGLSFAEEAVKMAPDLFVAHYALGSLLLQLGQVERAVRELEEAVRLAPGSADSRHVLAQAYVKAGRKEEAARERAEFQRLEELRRQQEMME